MEKKINLFESKKTKPTNLTLSNGTTIRSIPLNKTHVDLNYVKMDRILNFYRLKNTNSKITCHGRPTPKQVRSMKRIYKVNYCLTLQKQKENPQDIFKYCLDNDIEWQLIELDGANINYMKKKEVLCKIVDSLYSLCIKLYREPLVCFLHCAAGLHRTGTILYAILRVFGETPDSAMDAIGIIREDTRREVGNERIRLVENVIYPELMKKFKDNSIDFQNVNKNLIIEKEIDNKLSEKVEEKLKTIDISDLNKKNLTENNLIIYEEKLVNKKALLELNNNISDVEMIDKTNFLPEKEEKIKQIFYDLDS